jgi:hypothetical protein
MPGPWQVSIGHASGRAYGVETVDGRLPIVRFHGLARPAADGQANARLIAAAPELLEALKAVTPPHRALGCWCSYSRDTEGYGHEDGCKLARAAIAAAEGRTNG